MNDLLRFLNGVTVILDSPHDTLFIPTSAAARSSSELKPTIPKGFPFLSFKTRAPIGLNLAKAAFKLASVVLGGMFPTWLANSQCFGECGLDNNVCWLVPFVG